MKKKGYILLSVICAVVLIATGIILGVVMKKQSNKKTYTASIKTAEKYLEAGDYTQAVVAYKTAIEKMPEKETGYVGLANTTGVKASIIEGVNVFVAVLVASLLFQQEKLTGKKIVGCLIGFAGVVIVNLGGSMDMGFRLTGEGFIFLSTVAYAFSSVFLKRYSKDENPVLLSGYQFITGGIIMCVIGLLMGGKVHGFAATSTGMLVYLAVVSAVAYSLWGILLKYNPVSKVAVFGFMNPVFGVILSALLLGEGAQAAGVKSLIALLLVSIGIYVVNKKEGDSV